MGIPIIGNQTGISVTEDSSLLDKVVSETPHVDMRAIWKGEDQRYRTYDGRVCIYSTRMLAAVLGGDFATANASEQAAFLAYCINTRLDPVRKQVFFIRYRDFEPPSFVVSWEVFLERAQRHPQFDGYECGIVWKISQANATAYEVERGQRSNATAYEVERGQPCDYVPDEKHDIIGSWAVAYRKDRSHHAPVEVPVSEMITKNRKGELTRSYARMPTTMYTKVATARALRRAFPEDLAGLYTEHEAETLQEAIRETERLQSGAVTPPKDLDDLAALLNREGGAAAATDVQVPTEQPAEQNPQLSATETVESASAATTEQEALRQDFECRTLRLQILAMWRQNQIAGGEILKKHGPKTMKELEACVDIALLTEVHRELHELTAHLAASNSMETT